MDALLSRCRRRRQQRAERGSLAMTDREGSILAKLDGADMVGG
jgi:hypothetical protein